MAQVFTVKQKGGSRGAGIVVVRDDATGTVNLNNATNGANTSVAESVQSMTIAEVAWTLSAGTWTLDRGGTDVMVLQGSSGHLNFADNQLRLEQPSEETANVGYTLAGGTGTLVLKLHKRSTGV